MGPAPRAQGLTYLLQSTCAQHREQKARHMEPRKTRRAAAGLIAPRLLGGTLRGRKGSASKAHGAQRVRAKPCTSLETDTVP